MAMHAMDVEAAKGHAMCLEELGRLQEALEEWMKVFAKTGEASVAEAIAKVMKRMGGETRKRQDPLESQGSQRSQGSSVGKAVGDFKYDERYGALKTEYEDCCDILGVRITDSLEVVKKRFHVLARRYHPDRNADEETTKRFLEIRKAYEYIVANYSAS